MKASCSSHWSCGGGRASLSRILRRILCSLDHFREDERDSPVATVGVGVGVVARLMGLDSAPLPPYQELHDDKFFILSFEKRTLHHTEKSKKKIAIESANSSPKSVLEFVGFSADQESVSSGEMANPKTRRPLSEELESCGDSGSENLVIRRREALGIGNLAAAEAVRSTWLHQYHHKHSLLEIGRDVASYIFDHLLEELELELIVT